MLRDNYRVVPEATDAGIGTREVTELAALNETLREDYSEDCAKGINRWNRAIAEAGVDFELRTPHIGFNRNIGTFRDHHVSPDGQMIDDATWQAANDDWLPNDADKEHVQSLQMKVTEPGKMAGWLAPPSTRINQKPVDYDYVRL